MDITLNFDFELSPKTAYFLKRFLEIVVGWVVGLSYVVRVIVILSVVSALIGGVGYLAFALWVFFFGSR